MKTNYRAMTLTLASAALLMTGLVTAVRADHDDWEDRRERQRERAEDALERERERAEDWYDRAEDALRHEHRRHRRANWFGDWHDDYFYRQREQLHRERDRYEDHLDRLEDHHGWHHGHKVWRRPAVSTWGGYGYGVPRVDVRPPLPARHPPHCHCTRCEAQRLSFWLRTF